MWTFVQLYNQEIHNGLFLWIFQIDFLRIRTPWFANVIEHNTSSVNVLFT